MATHITTPPNKAWVQVRSQALTVPAQGSPKMKRIYKVPTTALKGILNYVKVGSTITAVEAWLGSAAGSLVEGLSGKTIFDIPSSISSDWVIDNYYIDQGTAGEYMELNATYGWTDFNIDAAASADNWSEEVQLGTTVTWQTYSVSPYIYCNEKAHDDRQLDENGHPIGNQTDDCLRWHIDQALTTVQAGGNQQGRWTNQQSGQAYILNDKELSILTKLANGVNPVFHKPIVQVTHVYRTNKENQVPSSGTLSVDTISSPGSGATASGWSGSYIYCGRSWTKSQQTYYTEQHPEGVTIYTMTFIDTWEGAMEPDQNFYGPNKWKFHYGPSGGDGGR